MTRYALVRVEATEGMLRAATMQVPTWDDEASRRKWTAMLSASPPLTDAEVDELTTVFWGEDEEPKRHLVEHELWEMTRKHRREQMRAFLAAIGGQP